QVFLDNLTVVNATGQATVIQDFENRVITDWTARNQQPGTGLFGIPTSAQAANGISSFRLDYTVYSRGATLIIPVVQVNVLPVGEIPIVVSSAFAKYYGDRSDARRSLRVDDRGKFSLPFPQGEVELSYRVVGITDDWFSSGRRDLF